MKKIILITALTGLFSLALTANQGLISAQSPQIAQTQGAIIPVAKAGLGKIRPGMSEQQVRRILGKPTSTKTEFSPGVGDNIRTLQYPNISLYLVPYVNKPKNLFFVYYFVTRSSKFLTPTGVKVGDTQSQVIKAYGKPYISKEGNVTFLVYGVGSPDSAAALTFRIEAGKVTEIQYSEQLL
ncbi:outer membrane protein assembly factor BamE [Aulosira sp. FACHB-615]|uniref:outer membrane protein assembly factor BamE domain-containing protein n=1 Tax=Aulosira sp. FACHB-615 TaxID=2692777 RepID=UPI0016840C21|nr:outer membrane protein assembly factor BamE [Aulosira sp. FACHB-615]MBD2489878.1 outer membrane protein assembly factor BamE [Aulosira sp. FACHB-615]